MHTHSSRTQAKPGLTLTMIALTFALPIVTAWWLYSSGYSTGKTLNHGKLIQPPIQIENMNTITPNPFAALQKWHGKWLLLLIIPPTQSLQEIETSLHQVIRVWLATSKYQHKVKPIVIMDAATATPKTLSALPYQKQITYLVSKPKQIQAQLDTLKIKESKDYRFIIDPKGYIILSYRTEQPPKDWADDLNKLLKLHG